MRIEISKEDTAYLINCLDAFVRAQGLSQAARCHGLAFRLQSQVNAHSETDNNGGNEIDVNVDASVDADDPVEKTEGGEIS